MRDPGNEVEVGIYKQTFRYCKYERRTIDSGKGQDLFIQRMLFSLNCHFIAEKKNPGDMPFSQ